MSAACLPYMSSTYSCIPLNALKMITRAEELIKIPRKEMMEITLMMFLDFLEKR